MKRNNIFEIASDFFGEDNVDLQESSLLIHWDRIVIENEYGARHDIYDLYAKINISFDGKLLGTSITRSTFTRNETISGYVHSHVIRQSGYVGFEHPCFGSGPIRDTSLSLSKECDGDLWRLFLVELDRYVRVESISGVPYIRMSSIGQRYDTPYRLSLKYSVASPEHRYYQRAGSVFRHTRDNNLIFPYIKTFRPLSFGSMSDAVVMLTKLTINYLKSSSAIYKYDDIEFCEACMREGQIMRIANRGYSALAITGVKDFSFKGKPVRFRVLDDNDVEIDTFNVVNEDFACVLLSMIMTDIYYNYNEYEQKYKEYESEMSGNASRKCQ